MLATIEQWKGNNRIRELVSTMRDITVIGTSLKQIQKPTLKTAFTLKVKLSLNVV